MFAIPGIGALIVFVMVRPQELFPALQRIPLLHLSAALAVLGYIVDLRLRRTQPFASPTLPWVVGFMLWAVMCTAISTPALLVPRVLELLILFALYFTISHGLQTFRALQLVIGVITMSCLFISAVCFQQGFAEKQCIVDSDTSDAGGTPDGRVCETSEVCRAGDTSGEDVHCDHVGLFGLTAVNGRVRYSGELHDPNEVSLTICAGGLAMLFGFARRRRQGLSPVLIGVAVLLVAWTVVLTGSRGGLVMMTMVPGVFIVRKWGLKAVIPVALLALPMMSLTSRSDDDAETSTEMRYEAWATGLTLFHERPLFGVGPRQFTSYHYITAHNSYVLTLAEMGFIGLVLFVSVLYLSIKSLVVGLRETRDIPGAKVAQIWGMSLLAGMCGIAFQIGTLSFAYQPVLWIFFGVAGAWSSSTRTHAPAFRVVLTVRDVAIVVIAALFYAAVVLPLFLRYKGFD